MDANNKTASNKKRCKKIIKQVNKYIPCLSDPIFDYHWPYSELPIEESGQKKNTERKKKEIVQIK